jgi:hypothetical protein
MDIEPILTRPTLWHSDLHSSNLFVDDGRIASVIEWQGSWAGPLFLQTQPSPLVDYQGDILLRRPENFDDLDSEHQTQIKQKIFKSTLFQLYLLETEKRTPLLTRTFHLDHGKTRRLPVELAGNTWDDDIVSFREALINVERYVARCLSVSCPVFNFYFRYWHDLGIQGDCPYSFTQAELHTHSVDADGWNEVQDFFDSIEGLVKRDGWTSPETFDAAFGFFSELRKRGLEHLKGDERDIFERQTRWARNTS